MIESADGQPVTDEQVAQVRNEALAIPGFAEPDNDPDNMWRERPYLDGASKDPSVRVIQNGLVNRLDAEAKVSALRAIPRPYGLNLLVGGTPALEQDSVATISAKLPIMILIAVSMTTLLMFLAFGSLVLPIKAALMNALTLCSTLGVLTWIFIDGHGASLLNFTPTPLTAPVVGLIIAVIFGLSTDYEVFLVSRMVEARAKGMTTEEAIRHGTATTGRLISAAALVLVVVGGAFAFSDLVMMQYLAIGLITALLLDAIGGPDVPGAGGDEAAGQRLLVGTAVDEVGAGADRPQRDCPGRRLKAGRGAGALGRGAHFRNGRAVAGVALEVQRDPTRPMVAAPVPSEGGWRWRPDPQPR